MNLIKIKMLHMSNDIAQIQVEYQNHDRHKSAWWLVEPQRNRIFEPVYKTTVSVWVFAKFGFVNLYPSCNLLKLSFNYFQISHWRARGRCLTGGKFVRLKINKFSKLIIFRTPRDSFDRITGLRQDSET